MARLTFGIRLVNLRREKCDIRIGRRSVWGNPFKIGADGTREEVIGRFRRAVENQRKWQTLVGGLIFEIAEWKISHPKAKEIRLGCWCHPAPCHGEVLIEAIARAKVLVCR